MFEEYDYHWTDTSAEPSKTDPIEITLKFAESKRDEWPDAISQRLADTEQIDSNELRTVILRITSKFDAVINEFISDYDFLNLSGDPLVSANNFRRLSDLRQLVPTFYLASLRDAAQEFRARSAFWKPFVRTLSLDDKDREELEIALQKLNNMVLEKHSSFEDVKKHLENTAKLLPLGDADPVSIEALPLKVFDILSRTQVYFASKTGAQIPLVRHDSGTQSLAIICLFDAFLKSQLEKKFSEISELLLKLEDLEAHLHPSAIKAIGRMLLDIPGQKLISTHSGDLLASIPLKKIRRLRCVAGTFTIHAIDEDVLTKDEINKLDYRVRSTRGSPLFQGAGY